MPLPLSEEDIPKAEKVRKCSACAEPGPFEVWGQPMCLTCAHAWDEAAPNDDAWDKKYPDDKTRFTAKKTWTAQWAAKRKAVAA